jgi:hypothetical protein
MRRTVLALALSLSLPALARAQDQAAPPPPPPPADPAAAPAPPPVEAAMAPPPAAPVAAPSAGPSLAWDGLVDTFYLYNFTGDPSVQGPMFRAFDQTANSFSLSYAKIGLSVNADPVAARIDLGYGHTAMWIGRGSIAGSGAGAKDPTALQLHGTGFLVQQAFGTVKFNNMVSLDAGKFVTTAGSEVIETNKNWLYSRSLLFGGIPFLHTGLRLNVKANDMVTVQASLVNGGVTNNDPDNNGWKTGGLSIGLAPMPALSLALTGYFGKEGVQGMEGDMNILVDLVANYTVSDKLSVNLNFDYFKAGDPTWLGAALMGRFIVSEMLYLALRGEFISTKSGGFGGIMGDATLFEGTLMAGIPFGKNFEIRLEGRGDFSNKELFAKGMTPRKNQITALAGFVAFF